MLFLVPIPQQLCSSSGRCKLIRCRCRCADHQHLGGHLKLPVCLHSSVFVGMPVGLDPAHCSFLMSTQQPEYCPSFTFISVPLFPNLCVAGSVSSLTCMCPWCGCSPIIRISECVRLLCMRCHFAATPKICWETCRTLKLVAAAGGVRLCGRETCVTKGWRPA